METTTPRILLVEQDPQIIDLVSRQSLKPLGYQVKVALDASIAIQQVLQFAPDLIITDLNLPGLSGKDLMIALTSQGRQIPTIVIAEKGQEIDLIQAFRLGAKDFLLSSARDAEIISVVENILRQVRSDQTRLASEKRQEEHIRELQQQIQDLTTLMAIGKELISTSDLPTLSKKLVESAMFIARANYGWLLLRNKTSHGFDLVDPHNLPKGWLSDHAEQMVSGLVSLSFSSGRPLSIKISLIKQMGMDMLGATALAIPIRSDQVVMGIMGIIRVKDIPFEKDRRALLEFLADYAIFSFMRVLPNPVNQHAIGLGV